MDVVCFVWDQCLIGAGVTGYQFLPHFTAAWLIVARERLYRCHSVCWLMTCSIYIYPCMHDTITYRSMHACTHW